MILIDNLRGVDKFMTEIRPPYEEYRTVYCNVCNSTKCNKDDDNIIFRCATTRASIKILKGHKSM